MCAAQDETFDLKIKTKESDRIRVVVDFFEVDM